MAAFGGFTFAADEEPIADTGWTRKAIADIVTCLGAARDSALIMGVGSARRGLDFYLTPARFAVIEALLGTLATLTDWESTPVSQSAILIACDSLDAATPTYGTTSARRLVRLEFLAQ